MRENSFNPADEYEQFYVPSVLVYSTPLLLERAAPRAGERVLDVACRTGIAARMAGPMVEPTGEITGVDISPNMLSVARRSSGNEDLEWIEGPPENLPFNDRSFDLVLCQHGLEFIADRQTALREMRRASAGFAAGARRSACGRRWIKTPSCRRSMKSSRGISTNRFRPSPKPFPCGDVNEVADWLVNAGLTRSKPTRSPTRCVSKDTPRFIKLLFAGARRHPGVRPG